MAVCRCDPTSVHERGPRAGLPQRPQVYVATVVHNGRPVAVHHVLHCARCKSTWRGE